MRRIFMAFIFAIAAFGFSISADADGLSGLLIEIPGYTGSGVISCADLSSAVMQPVDDGVVIIACVKNITRSGEGMKMRYGSLCAATRMNTSM